MAHTGNLPTEAIQYLSVEQVLAAHTELIKCYGGSQGVRNRGLLESAVFRPQASAFGQEAYPTLFEKCAVLGYSLIQNHPFLDGNKRTFSQSRASLFNDFSHSVMKPSSNLFSFLFLQ